MLFVYQMALVMWGINRVNPYEWGGRRNLGHATDDEGDTFNLLGSLWFTFATLQWQGTLVLRHFATLQCQGTLILRHFATLQCQGTLVLRHFATLQWQCTLVLIHSFVA